MTNFDSRGHSGAECRLLIGRRRPLHPELGLFYFISLLLLTSCNAFCRNPTRGASPIKSTRVSSTALGLLRPDWMRRAGRIEQKRKERREMFEALRKRQEELGIPKNLFGKKKDPKPQRYRVVSASDTNETYNSTANGISDGLAIYPFVPEDEIEANDETNVLDWLGHGEIVTAIRSKKVIDESVPPPPTAVLAVTLIYNIQPKIQRDILWIEHDRGGWSPTIVDGTTRLIPIGDAN